MPLTLSIVSPPPAGRVELTRRLESGKLTIGRGPDNDWILPDNDAVLGRAHCRIESMGDGFALIDTSRNGVFLNESEEPLGNGNQAMLADGDRFVAGPYEIAVRIEARVTEPASEIHPRRAPPLVDDNPFADPGGPDPEHSPFDRLPPPGVGAPFGHDPLSDGPVAPHVGRPFIPEDADLLPREDYRDPWAEDRGPSQPDHVPEENEGFIPPRVVPASIPEDWDKDPGPAPAPASPHAEPRPPASEAASKAVDHREQPQVGRTPPRSAPPQPAPAAIPHGEMGLLEAFLAGAGAELLPPGPDPEHTMRMVGELFRAMVEGLRDTLIARAAIKNEFRLERTIIQAGGNNPLKFSANADEALWALLTPPRSGYLSPAEAVKEGFEDIKAHELATVAGMQAALRGLLEELEPGRLKKQVDETASKRLLPGSQKAKYWEGYEALFRGIARDADDNFRGRYAREFIRAYEEQIRKL